MVFWYHISSSISNALNFELEKIFPRTFFLEKIILTTDFSGIVHKYFLEGVICWFINYNSNKKNYNSAIVNFMTNYLHDKIFLKIQNFKFINFKPISLSTTICGKFWQSFIFLLIFSAKCSTISKTIIMIYPPNYEKKIIILRMNYNNFKNTFLNILSHNFMHICFMMTFTINFIW